MNEDAADKPIPRTRSTVVANLSRVFSFVFHPLIMTATSALVIYKILPVEFSRLSAQFGAWMGYLLLFTLFLPLLAILLFRFSGLISNARMHHKRDRILPLIATMMFYILAYWVFTHRHAPLFLRTLLLGSSLGIMIIFMINLFYKVSVHTTAAAIPAGILLVLILNRHADVFAYLWVAALIALFVGVIRWLLGAHTIGQILLGYTIGVVTQLAAYFFVISG